jgi:peptidylprolyl isomerase
VAGHFGTNPKITIPDQSASSNLTVKTLIQGTGPVLNKTDAFVGNYAVYVWSGKTHKLAQSTFQTKTPQLFSGTLLPGLETALQGKKMGSRVLAVIPPKEGYGKTGNSSAGVSATDTLVFVIDMIATYKPDASAPGTAIAKLPTTDFPKILNPVGKAPKIVSSAGVKAPTKPVSTLLVKGTGEPIDIKKTLVLQIVQSDIKTNTKTQSSWGKAPQTVSAQNVLGVATNLNGQKVGTRALILVPPIAATPATASAAAQAASPAQILIVDVVGEF